MRSSSSRLATRACFGILFAWTAAASCPTGNPLPGGTWICAAYCGPDSRDHTAIHSHTLNGECEVEGAQLYVIGRGFTAMTHDSLRVMIGNSSQDCMIERVSTGGVKATENPLNVDLQPFEELQCRLPCAPFEAFSGTHASASAIVPEPLPVATVRVTGGNVVSETPFEIQTYGSQHKTLLTYTGQYRGKVNIDDAHTSTCQYAKREISNIECMDARDGCEIQNFGDESKLMIVPVGARLKITGTNFGAVMPEETEYEASLRVGQVSCPITHACSLMNPACDQSWTMTQIIVTMCAQGGSGLEVALTIGKDLGSYWKSQGYLTVNVKVPAAKPTDLVVVLADPNFNALGSAVVASWVPPEDKSCFGYVIRYTVTSHSGHDLDGIMEYAIQSEAIHACIANRHCDMSVLRMTHTLGYEGPHKTMIYLKDVVSVSVGAVYATDPTTPPVPLAGETVSDWATWFPRTESSTPVYMIRASTVANPPMISSVKFVGHTAQGTGYKEDEVDVLLRYGNIQLNGGTPVLAILSDAFNLITDPPLATFQMKENDGIVGSQQLGIVSNIPINIPIKLSLTIGTYSERGFQDAADALYSEPSSPFLISIQAPPRVTNLIASFVSAERGGSTFSVAIEWTKGVSPKLNAYAHSTMDEGEAPVTGHSVYQRSAPSGTMCVTAVSNGTSIESVASSAVTSAATCQHPALLGSLLNTGENATTLSVLANNSIVSYTQVEAASSPVPKLVVSGLAVDAAFCFVVVAANAIGQGLRSTNEVCIDVGEMLKSRCEVGTVMTNASIFHCEKCPVGSFNSLRGASCSKCPAAKWTLSARGASECAVCADNTYSVDGMRCDKCPSTKLLRCRAGVVEWEPHAWYNTGAWRRDKETNRLEWHSTLQTLDETTPVYPCFNDVACQYASASTPAQWIKTDKTLFKADSLTSLQQAATTTTIATAPHSYTIQVPTEAGRRVAKRRRLGEVVPHADRRRLTGTTCNNGFAAKYLHIMNEGGGGQSFLNLQEVVLEGPSSEMYSIVGGTMSSTYSTDVISNCFDGITDDPNVVCHSGTSSNWWASFDLGVEKCVVTVKLYNRVAFPSRLVGAIVSLRSAADVILWSQMITSGGTAPDFILTFPEATVSPTSAPMIPGATGAPSPAATSSATPTSAPTETPTAAVTTASPTAPITDRSTESKTESTTDDSTEIRKDVIVCSSALGYFGPLCGACEREERFIRSGLACAQCPAHIEDNYPYVGGLCLFVVVMVVYIGVFRSTRRRVGEYGGIIRRIAFSYMQMLGVLGIFKAKGTKVFSEMIGKTSQIAGGSVTSMLSVGCLLPLIRGESLQAYGPFLLNMILPPLLALLMGAVLLPTTIWRRRNERKRVVKDAKQRSRRHRAVVHTRRASLLSELNPDSPHACVPGEAEAEAEGEAVGEGIGKGKGTGKGADDAIELEIDNGTAATKQCDSVSVHFVPPRFEPLFNFDGLKSLKIVQKKIICCRRQASQEYINNALRKSLGQMRTAPLTRSIIPFDRDMLGGIPHAVVVSCKCMRTATSSRERALWRSNRAITKGTAKRFEPTRRFMAVMVLVMYSLFPTLVASTASMLNCSDAIAGKRYLMADLTVTCFEGAHLFFIALSVTSVVIYCLGTPITFAVIIAYEMCAVVPPRCLERAALAGDTTKSEEDEYTTSWRSNVRSVCCWKIVCICSRRDGTPWGYRTASFREQFGLLVAGYDTERGSLVMAWEFVVMLRKLFITLAGSLPRDPYLQIMSALVILVGSLTLQALVQPYESRLLNVLDVGSLFVLIVTQALSIMYLYLDAVDETSMPYGMPRKGVEIAITIALFIANASVIFTLFAAWILRLSYEKLPQLIAELKRRRSHKQQQQHEASDSGLSVDEDVEMARIRRLSHSNTAVAQIANARRLSRRNSLVFSATDTNDDVDGNRNMLGDGKEEAMEIEADRVVDTLLAEIETLQAEITRRDSNASSSTRKETAKDSKSVAAAFITDAPNPLRKTRGERMKTRARVRSTHRSSDTAAAEPAAASASQNESLTEDGAVVSPSTSSKPRLRRTRRQSVGSLPIQPTRDAGGTVKEQRSRRKSAPSKAAARKGRAEMARERRESRTAERAAAKAALVLVQDKEEVFKLTAAAIGGSGKKHEGQ